MFIIKKIIYNKYLISLKSIVLLLILSLIPWIDFINSNFEEIEFIFNNNFFILIFFYFIFFFIIFLFGSLISKQTKFDLVILYSFSI